MTTGREITVPKVARLLDCSIPHAQSLIRTHRIPGRRTARGWVTTIAAVDAYIAARSSKISRSGSARKS